MNKEIWKPIEGFEGRYEVSSLGRVRSLRFRNCNVDKKRDIPKILKPNKIHGYFLVSLGDTSKSHPVKIHQLVCKTFHGKRPSKSHHCAHLDGNKENNVYWNLKWATAKENESHKKLHGTSMLGEKNHNSKFTSADVLKIKKLLLQKIPQKTIAKSFNVTKQAISLIETGKNWKHITV